MQDDVTVQGYTPVEEWHADAEPPGKRSLVLRNSPSPTRGLLGLFETERFAEKWKRVFEGLKMPQNSGAHKWARLQMVRLFAPVAAVVVPCIMMFLLLVLGANRPPPTRAVKVTIVEPEPLEELEKLEEMIDEPIEPPEPIETDVTPDVMVDVDAPLTLSPEADYSSQPTTFDAVAMIKSPVMMKGIMGSRTPGQRGSALARHGGSGGTEAAVMRALRWLKKNQSSDGSWNAQSGGAAPNPGGELYAGTPQAFTALAVLTFLAHGETPASEEFGETVARGLKWFLSHQGDTGTFGVGYVPGTDLGYSHFIATYALCEAAALTRIPDVVYAAEKAVQRILDGQHDNGGWDYDCRAGTRVDVSVISWCVQALKAARIAKLSNEGIKEALDRAGECFRTVLFDQSAGTFHYDSAKAHAGALSGLSCTAVLSLQMIGGKTAASQEARQGVQWLTQNARFSWGDPWGRSPLYYCYYTTQVMFHEGGQIWGDWNKQFSPELVKNQTVVKGEYQWQGRDCEIGFWKPVAMPAGKAEYCQAYVYNTTLCALSLMVYYRYLPTYVSVGIDEDVPLDDDEDDIEITIL
jgi:hypothetical protein